MAELDWETLKIQFLAYRAGDAKIARPLFTAIQRALTGYYRMRMSDFATNGEDMVQAALMKMHFARDRFDSAQSLKTWVFTIASRTLIDHWRGQGAELTELTEEETNAPDPSPGQELTTRLRTDLNQALLSLKPLDRSIVYLHGVEEFSTAEIAQSLHLSEGAVKVRAHRAYKALQALMAFLFFFLGAK